MLIIHYVVFSVSRIGFDATYYEHFVEYLALQ